MGTFSVQVRGKDVDVEQALLNLEACGASKGRRKIGTDFQLSRKSSRRNPLCWGRCVVVWARRRLGGRDMDERWRAKNVIASVDELFLAINTHNSQEAFIYSQRIKHGLQQMPTGFQQYIDATFWNTFEIQPDEKALAAHLDKAKDKKNSKRMVFQLSEWHIDHLSEEGLVKLVEAQVQLVNRWPYKVDHYPFQKSASKNAYVKLARLKSDDKYLANALLKTGLFCPAEEAGRKQYIESKLQESELTYPQKEIVNLIQAEITARKDPYSAYPYLCEMLDWKEYLNIWDFHPWTVFNLSKNLDVIRQTIPHAPRAKALLERIAKEQIKMSKGSEYFWQRYTQMNACLQLGIYYAHQGKNDEAKQMIQRAHQEGKFPLESVEAKYFLTSDSDIMSPINTIIATLISQSEQGTLPALENW